MRFLCVCQDGNVRSVGLAFLLHNKNGQEAVPVGWKRLSEESLTTFCEWADRIVIMQAEYQDRIPEQFRNKILVSDVGPDRFGNGMNKELRRLLEPIVEKWKAEGVIK